MRKGRLALAIALALMAGSAQATTIWIGDNSGTLFTADTGTGATTLIGNMGFAAFDIAFDPAGNLYALDLGGTALYSVNESTAATTLIGSTGAFTEGLAFRSDGVLFASGGTGIYTVNPATGAATLLGSTGGPASAGDVAFDASGNLYMSDISGNLVGIDQTTGAGTIIGATGFFSVFGLAFADGTMFGTAGEEIFAINLATGAGTFLSDYTSSPGLTGANGATALAVSEAVPEPSTIGLLALGIGGILLGGRRRNS